MSYPSNTNPYLNQQIMRLSVPETQGKEMGVVVYNGTNYFEWSSQLQVVLFAADLWRVTESGLPKGATDDEFLTSAEQKERKEKLEKMLTKNDKALGKILLSVDMRYRTKILEQMCSAKEAWEFLKKDSLAQSTVRARTLTSQFTRLKYSPEMEMPVY